MANSKLRAYVTDEMFRNLVFTISLPAALLLFVSPCYSSELVRRLELLHEQYQNLPTIHFEANSITLHGTIDEGTEQRRVKASYMYWGKDTEYRINSSMGPEDTPVDRDTTHIAYNGQRFQYFDVTDSLLNYRKEDIDVIPAVPPNPLLYPVIFLSPGLERPCARLRFKDLYNDEVWERLLHSAKIVSSGGPGEKLVFELPGGYEGDIRCVFHVHLGTDPDFMPVKVVRLSDNGSELAKFTIEEYETINIAGKKSYWPKSVQCETLDNGKVIIDAKTTINVLELDKELPPGIFTIDFTLADVLWDDDYQVALKTPSGNIPTPKIPTSVDIDILDRPDLVSEVQAKSGETSDDIVSELQSGQAEVEASAANVNNSEVYNTPLASSEQVKQYRIWLAIICVVFAAIIAYILIYSWIKKTNR